MKCAVVACFLIAMLLFLVPSRVAAQSEYKVVTLPTLGGVAGQANSINDRGWATGLADFSGDSVGHAALWTNEDNVVDLGSLGGVDANSAVAWPVKDNRGVIVGISDTDEDNPLAEAFSCWPFFAPGNPTGKICKGFRWANGVMTALPPFPGGYNSYATAANNRGEIVGWAENGQHDPTCDPSFQILQFRAVIWEPNGSMRELRPLPGDSTSAATAINDRGDVVGISGACGIAVGSVSAAHAVIWHNGVPQDIGSFGGHAWNTPTAINNNGTVVGFSLPASQEGTNHFQAFIWTAQTGIRHLPVPSTDIRSEALGINERDQVVGLSRAPSGIRAVVWQNGTFADLNDLVAVGSPPLLYANDINDSGLIVGEASNASTGTIPGFVAIPISRDNDASGNRKQSRNKQSFKLSDEDEKKAERRGFRFGNDPRD